MEKQTLSVPRISGIGSVAAIQEELGEVFGILTVEGNAASKTITVEWEVPTDLEIIQILLQDIDYPAYPLHPV